MAMAPVCGELLICVEISNRHTQVEALSARSLGGSAGCMAMRISFSRMISLPSVDDVAGDLRVLVESLLLADTAQDG
jgi:hypothetical protein